MERPICIVGTGYVGMACLVGLAELGWRVNGYDVAAERIDRLRRGIPPYREDGILEPLKRNVASGRIAFFDSLKAAAEACEIVIIAVGTPSRDDGSADISALEAALLELSTVRFATRPTVVIRSTVPPGTSDTLAGSVEPWGELIYAPEFLREGAALFDFLNPSRIVVGATAPPLGVRYVSLFAALQKPIVFTSRCDAELIKCCSNAYLALKISYANEVANLCDALGGSADDVLRGIGYDPRIGPDFLRPGIGFGGPCFEKDVKSINHVAAQTGSTCELFSATLRVNNAQPLRLIDRLEEECGDLEGLHVGVWGLAFKAGTDDIRDSLALRIVEELGRRGATLTIYDPAVRIAPLPAGARLTTSALEAAEADALVVLTEWPEFGAIDPASYAQLITSRVVIDGRNILDRERVSAAGLTYRGVGRGLEERPRTYSPAPALSR
ncbi:MAG: UDP-glucose/GDP-mannose dehydrogenase family protein [Candidatus Baltobacteraceae bacterium]